MLDKILKVFNASPASHHSKVIYLISSVIELMDEKYMADKNARDALIDSCITLLQNCKENKFKKYPEMPSEGSKENGQKN
jgi:hypothetical protein